MYYAGEFQDGINNMSYDDLTYDTMTIGYKPNNWKTKSTTSSVHSSNTTKRGNSRLSEVCRRSGLTYGLTKLGLPYLIDRWYDDTPRSRISVQFYLLSGSSLHSLIDVRVYIDRKYLVIT